LSALFRSGKGRQLHTHRGRGLGEGAASGTSEPYAEPPFPSIGGAPMTDSSVQADTRSPALIVGICLVAAATFVVLASINYMLPPMLADLGLTMEEGNLILKVPSLASLLVVFVAGRAGDRIGHRRVIIAAGLLFILGSFLVATAQGLAMVAIGMFIEGVAATGIQIVIVGLLALRFVEPRARAAAFGTYGMAFPAVYLIFPVVAGWLTTFVSWRAIPWMWVIAGIVLMASALFLLPNAQRKPVGELWTPLLAGLFAVGIIQFISHASDFGITSLPALISLGTVVASFLACTVFYRRFANPSLSLAPFRNGAMRIILVVVILVPTLNTIFYITVALQYMFGLSAFHTALLLIPAQIASIIGAKIVSERLTDRLGIQRAGVLLLLVLAGVMAVPLTFSSASPLWLVVTFAAAFGAAVTAVSVVTLNALMSSAPPEESGNTAAYEGSATEIGIALSVVLMTALVFGVGRASLETGLAESGLPTESAVIVIAELEVASASPAISAAYSYPLPDGGDASEVKKQAIAEGLRANGAAGVVISLIAAALFGLHRRRKVEVVDGAEVSS
jgi:MFS family permease